MERESADTAQNPILRDSKNRLEQCGCQSSAYSQENGETEHSPGLLPIGVAQDP
jgi:hypothetical protein